METVKKQTVSCLQLGIGMRFVHIRHEGAVEYCGVGIHAGSRNESPEEYGLAHFVEHTIFKGTDRRSASRIINHMEAVGGELNAYTTKEETYVYSIFPAGNFRRALDLIADLVLHSRFPDSELDKEREVVAEEIDSYLDQPSEAVFDDFDDLIFKGTSLGHNILGNTATLRKFDSRMCRKFVERWYVAPNMVFFYLGPQPVEKVARMVETAFADLPQGNPSVSDTQVVADNVVNPFDVRRGDDDNHQAHTVMGCIVPSIYSPERYALTLLNNIIGGPGMNSRLNVALRERRGLVYNVESSLTLYSDIGLFTLYYGCNPEDNDRCHKLVEREIGRLCDTQMSERALAAARRQFLGQQIVASSSSEQVILSAARSMMYYGTVTSRVQMQEIINAITPADITRATALITPTSLSSLTLL